MSHAKEIKEKQALQARFQLAINSTSNHVSSWLKPSISSKPETTSSNISNTNDDFLNLPIISGGSGLSLTTDSHVQEDINTIGEYIKSGKSLSSLNKKRNQQSQRSISQLHKVHKTDSKALSSLRNKMKNSTRSNQRGKENTHFKSQQLNRQVERNNDSDSDDEVVQKSAPKKNFTLMIDSKIKKKTR